jgi:hypothetical protein
MTSAAGPIRQIVVDTWTTVLGTKIDDDADFFLLGGHSMLATRILARISRDLGVKITFRELLDHAVLHEFVSLVEIRVAAHSQT